MDRRRIAIIGKGTAGALAAAHFCKYTDWEVDWHFDPSISTLSVGEGATTELPYALSRTIGFTHSNLPEIDGNFKTGIRKVNWSSKNPDFRIEFPPPTVAYHYNAVKLQQYIFDKVKNRVTIKEGHISHDQIDCDYIIDSTGTPKDFSDFNMFDYVSVNSAYITQCYWDHPTFSYTGAIARKHGWVFAVPLLNRCAIGYVYNNDISLKDDIKEDVKIVFDMFGVSPSDTTADIKFRSYYRKQNYSDRVCYNGNSSFFIEPMEAHPIAHIQRNISFASQIWKDKTLTPEQANIGYQTVMQEIEFVVNLHYLAGSTFDTSFWTHAKQQAYKNVVNYGRSMLNRYMAALRADQDSSLFYGYGYDNPEARLKRDQRWWFRVFTENVKELGLIGELIAITRKEAPNVQ